MPTYIETHATDVSVRKWNLVELFFSPVLRLATCDFDVVALTHTWLGRSSGNGRPCNVPSIAMQGGVFTSATVQLADGDEVIYTILKATNGGQGVPVNIWEAWFDATNETAIPDATQLRAAGKIDASSKDETSGNDLVELAIIGQGGGANVYIPRRLVADLTKV